MICPSWFGSLYPYIRNGDMLHFHNISAQCNKNFLNMRSFVFLILVLFIAIQTCQSSYLSIPRMPPQMVGALASTLISSLKTIVPSKTYIK